MISGLRILVAEDDPDLLLVMRHELALAGHEIMVAETADEAVARAPDSDLVLLDFHLPGATGMDVLHAIQRLPRPPSVVVITGDDLNGLDHQAMQAGAVDFVPKRPGYLRALPGIVQRAARQHGLVLRVADFEAVTLSLLGAESIEDAREEIVRGACRMMRADGAALVRVVQGQAPFVAAETSMAQDLFDVLGAVGHADLPAAGAAMEIGPDGLVSRLPSSHGTDGWMLLVSGVARPPTADQRLLALAFCRVAAKALRTVELRRGRLGELEQGHAVLTKRLLVHDKTYSAVSEQLDRASSELAALLDGGESDPVVVRRVARAEAHVTAAKDAVADLVEPGKGG